MAKSARQALGARGEDLAVAELQRQGMEVLARNWRCRLGEIDIVAAELVDGRTTVVFCEVKTRSGFGFGHPLEAITWAKRRKLRSLAAEWLSAHEVYAAKIRIDAIGVLLVRGEEPRLTHVRGVG
jgi:putative endonuclease